jgi:hypothetical protein
MKNEPDAGPVQLVHLAVDAEPKYLLGFPVVVAVTFDNSRNAWNHYGLPMIDLFTEGAVLELELEPVAEGKAMRTGSLPSDAWRATFDLGPGEVRRMTWDLTNIGIPMSPGVYRLALRLRFAGRESASAPVTVEFVQPPTDQAAEATRLRRLGQTSFDSGSWVPFLVDNWHTVELAPCLGAMARRQLALHLFLHRSIYSSTATALLDASSLRSAWWPDPGSGGGSVGIRNLARSGRFPCARCARGHNPEGMVRNGTAPRRRAEWAWDDRGGTQVVGCREPKGTGRGHGSVQAVSARANTPVDL